MASRSGLHKAKCEVLSVFSRDLSLIIRADYENFRFELYARRLISREAREEQSAKGIVREIEMRLRFDESAWDQLISVLKGNNAEILCSRLEESLMKEAEKMGIIYKVGEPSGCCSSSVIDSAPHQQSRVVIGHRVQELFEVIRNLFHSMVGEVVTDILRSSELEDVKEYLEEKYPELAVGLRAVHSQNDLKAFVQKNCSFSNFEMLERLGLFVCNARVWHSLYMFERTRNSCYRQILAQEFVTEVREMLRASHAKITFETRLPKNEATLEEFKMLLKDLFQKEGIDTQLIEVISR